MLESCELSAVRAIKLWVRIHRHPSFSNIQISRRIQKTERRVITHITHQTAPSSETDRGQSTVDRGQSRAAPAGCQLRRAGCRARTTLSITS